MKLTILTTLIFSSLLAQAGTDTSFNCQAETAQGSIVTVSGCFDPADHFVPCPDEQFEYITIQRSTPLAKQTPDMVETVRIPGRLIGLKFNPNEELSLSIDFKIPSRKMSFLLDFTGGEVSKNTMYVDVFSSRNKFRNISCQFNDI